jgi:hypothetical protein
VIQIDNVLVSLEILQEEFVCNLGACKGICCVEGDYGAPITQDEIEAIKRNYTSIKEFMDDNGRKVVENNNFYELDIDEELVTQCVEGKECVFATQSSQGIYSCAIELAYQQKKSDFRKPISCYLYPIRVQKLSNGVDALNYDRWSICGDACTLGSKLKVKVYEFLKEPLIEAYGLEWYIELDKIAKEFTA